MTKRINNRSMASRVTSLEDAIHTLKELLDPTETRIMFLGPGRSEPNPDELDKGTVIIRFVSEVKEPDPDEWQRLREEVEARAAEREAAREAEREAEIQAEGLAFQTPEPAREGAARKQDTVIEVAQGVRWVFQPSIKERHKNFRTRPGWARLNRSRII
jgi:hypothetical protein